MDKRIRLQFRTITSVAQYPETLLSVTVNVRCVERAALVLTFLYCSFGEREMVLAAL